jgi:ABC-type glutathione transport system ATPase component
MPTDETPLLSVRGLTKHFTSGFFNGGRESLRAVDGVSFDILAGETLALVGESGCGKTTVGRLIAGLLRPTAGSMEFRSRSIVGLRGRPRRAITRHIQMVFQDPAGSLNPRMRIGRSIAEPLRAHRLGTRESQRERVRELLGWVGLDPDADRRYPHEFSGGQRQRIGIARAIALRPELVIADEPTSALDVSIRVQILNLLEEIQQRFGTSFLLISHDLAVVRHYSRRVAVMEAGRLVEEGATDAILDRPAHPCTQRLLSSVPSLDPHRKRILASAPANEVG